MLKKIKITTWFIFLFVLFFSFISFATQTGVQKIIITKEDIENAVPSSPFLVKFTKKDLKYIEIMEKRHFPRTYPEFSDKQRLKNLEYELLGRVWEFTPQKDRIDRLKIASSNVALQGTALPASLSSKRMVKRMRNTSIQIRQRDDVGLIDGFLRLMSPEKYEVYRQYSDKMFEKYD